MSEVFELNMCKLQVDSRLSAQLHNLSFSDSVILVTPVVYPFTLDVTLIADALCFVLFVCLMPCRGTMGDQRCESGEQEQTCLSGACFRPPLKVLKDLTMVVQFIPGTFKPGIFYISKKKFFFFKQYSQVFFFLVTSLHLRKEDLPLCGIQHLLKQDEPS